MRPRDPRVQIPKVRFEIHAVVRPRDTVHPRRRPRRERRYAARRRSTSTWCKSAVNRASLSVAATRRTRPSALARLARHRVRARFADRVPLGRSPSLHRLRRPASGVVRPLPRYYGPSDFSRSSITGLRPQPSPRDPPLHHDRRVTVRSPGSQLKRSRACTGPSTPRGPLTARENAANDVAFR